MPSIQPKNFKPDPHKTVIGDLKYMKFSKKNNFLVIFVGSRLSSYLSAYSINFSFLLFN